MKEAVMVCFNCDYAWVVPKWQGAPRDIPVILPTSIKDIPDHEHVNLPKSWMLA